MHLHLKKAHTHVHVDLICTNNGFYSNPISYTARLESLELFKFIVSFDLADNLQTISSMRKFSIFSERNDQVGGCLCAALLRFVVLMGDIIAVF